MKNKLCYLAVGESATVVDNISKGSIRRRLIDIGFAQGTKVKCLFKSPFGDPTAYKIRGAVIALRKEDSKKIIITDSGGEISGIN